MKAFVVGREYLRKKIHDEWGGGRQGGISPSRRFPVVFLFTGKSGKQYGYDDARDSDGVFWYTGEGRVGNMKLTNGNLAIATAHERGRRLYLFEQTARGRVTFLGEFDCIGRRERRGPDQRGRMRRVIQFGLLEVAPLNYWLEITDRHDIGTDLWAPQAHEGGKLSQWWGYALMRDVRPRDVVLHYDTNSKSIVAYSRAVRKAEATNVRWRSHVTGSRAVRGTPQRRPGWSLPLEDTVLLQSPLSLQAMRRRQGSVKKIQDDWARVSKDARYMPFVFRRDGMRPQEAYLTRFPLALLRLFLALHEITRPIAAPVLPVTAAARPSRSRSGTFGKEYQRVDVNKSVAKRKPFDTDPDKVDRGVRSHRKTQELLQEFVKHMMGCTPRSPDVPREPPFDLGWERDGVCYVVEVKSLTKDNEERQLRLGLGQVLDYWRKLTKAGRKVRAVLALERGPTDRSFIAFCQVIGVVVVWPGVFPTLVDASWPARDLSLVARWRNKWDAKPPTRQTPVRSRGSRVAPVHFDRMRRGRSQLARSATPTM